MANEWPTDSDDEARRQFGELLNQANALYESGEVGEAVSRYGDLVDFVRIRIGPETDAYGIAQFLLGRAYHQQERWGRAIECLRESMRILDIRSIDGYEALERVWLFSEALTRDRKNDREKNLWEAIRLFEGLRRRIRADQSPGAAAYVDSEIAELHRQRGDLAEAVRGYNDILTRLSAFETDHAGLLSQVHTALAVILEKATESLADAERHYRHALRFQIADEGGVSTRTILRSNDLCGFLLGQNRVEEAGEVFRDGWDFYQRLPNAGEIACLLRHYREWLQTTGLYPERLDWISEKSRFEFEKHDRWEDLRQAERLYGKDALELVRPLRSILIDEDNLDSKIDVQVRMLAIQQKHLDPEDPEVFRSRNHLVSYLIRAGQLSEAETFLASAEHAFRASSKYEGRENLSLLELRARLAEKRDDLELARDYYRKLEEILGHLDPAKEAYEIAEYYYRMARFSFGHQDYAEAERLFKTGIRIWVEHLSLNYSEELVDYYSNLATSLREMNRHEEAAAVEEQGKLVCRHEDSGEGS